MPRSLLPSLGAASGLLEEPEMQIGANRGPHALWSTAPNFSLVSVVRLGINFALSLLQTRYEGNADPDEDMAFHNVQHTAGVVRRTGTILHAMGASQEETQLGLLAAAFHDTVQRWAPLPIPDGKVMRKRFTAQNEADSAGEAIEWMHCVGRGVFHPEDCDLIAHAITATIPGWDADNLTVSQPNLLPDDPLSVRALALADLGIAGTEPESFVFTGDQLFREENLDIARAIRGLSAGIDLDAEMWEKYKARMISWSKTQAPFAHGRKARLNLEMGDLAPAAAANVRALFSGFDAAIAAAEEATAIRSSLPPWEVARAMGYQLPS